MLLIGVGAGVPWGLMDALSVSVVPKERAGMASGIFNTTKAASEGVSLAVVTVVLVDFVGSKLGLSPEVAQSLAMGDLDLAARLSGLSTETLVQSYGWAFRGLTWMLATVAVVAAAAAFTLLGPEIDDRTPARTP